MRSGGADRLPGRTFAGPFDAAVGGDPVFPLFDRLNIPRSFHRE
jgi:hypothetical protein